MRDIPHYVQLKSPDNTRRRARLKSALAFVAGCLTFYLVFPSLRPKPTVGHCLSQGHLVPAEVSVGARVLRFNASLHLYTVEGKPVLWALWNETELPSMIKLSLASVHCFHSPDFHLEVVRAADIGIWLDNVHPAFEFLKPAHQADYFRARILDSFGGMYVDSDTIGLGDGLRVLVDKLSWYTLTGASWWPSGDPVALGAIGPTRAASDWTAAWVTRLHAKLDTLTHKLRHWSAAQNATEYPLKWDEILRQIVGPLTNDFLQNRTTDFTYFSTSGPETFGQLIRSRYGPEARLDSLTADLELQPTPLLFWHNSVQAAGLRAKAAPALLRSRLLISELLLGAFRRCLRGDRAPLPTTLLQPKLQGSAAANATEEAALIDAILAYADGLEL